MKHSFPALLLTAALAASLPAQQPSETQPQPSSAQQQPSSTQRTPEQTAQFAAAQKDFSAQHWNDALTKLRALHDELPGDAVIAKFAAEASLDTGDQPYALSLLKPIAAASPDDWQALALLARAYAESHQDAPRDASLAQLVALHKSTSNDRFRNLIQFMVERIPTPGGHIDLYYSLTPWSRYNIYEMARVFKAAGQQTERITLESDDFDQPMWAKQHSQEAAAGMRMFSMDGYSEPIPQPNGTSSQTHSTFGFFDGRPSYNTVRDRMVQIAAGKTGPMSTTTGIPMPAKR